MKSSLSFRISLYTVLTVGGLSVLFTWQIIHHEVAAIKRMYDAKVENLASSYAAAMQADIYDYRVHKIRDSVISLFEDHEVVSVMVMDGETKVIYAKGEHNVSRGELAPLAFVRDSFAEIQAKTHRHYDRLYANVLILKPNGLPVGSVMVGLTLEHESRYILDSARNTIAFGLIIVTAALFTSMFLANSICRQITKLEKTALKIKAGDLSARVPDLASKEFSLLGEAFNDTAAKLSATILDTDELRQRLHLILKHIPDHIIVCDSNGGIISTNRADDHYEFVSYYYPGDSENQFNRTFEIAKETGKVAEFEYLCFDTHWYATRILPMSDNTEDQHYIVIKSDISSYKNFAELESLYAQLEESMEETRLAAQAKEQFLANMSHEIRTPMNSIIGFSDLLVDSKLDEQQQEWVSIIQYNGENLIRLVNQILDVSKIRSGTLELKPTVFTLKKNLKLVVASFMPACAQKGLELNFDMDASLPKTVEMDAGVLHQIMVNLIGNATKFTQEGGISVAAKKVTQAGNERLQIIVSDTGCGIPQSKQEEVFSPFTQADDSLARNHEGAGLGLSIAKSLVDFAGGSIAFDSVEGKGSTFYVELPYERVAVEKKLQGHSAVVASAKNVSVPKEFKSLRIIAAEDNSYNQKLLKIMMRRLGCKIEMVMNGEELVERLNDTVVDLILMDINMPKMDGLEATRKIRAGEVLPENKSAKIIALSAAARLEDTNECYEAGMDGFLSKPFKYEEMVEVLNIVMTSDSAKDSLRTA